MSTLSRAILGKGGGGEGRRVYATWAKNSYASLHPPHDGPHDQWCADWAHEWPVLPTICHTTHMGWRGGRVCVHFPALLSLSCSSICSVASIPTHIGLHSVQVPQTCVQKAPRVVLRPLTSVSLLLVVGMCCLLP